MGGEARGCGLAFGELGGGPLAEEGLLLGGHGGLGDDGTEPSFCKIEHEAGGGFVPSDELSPWEFAFHGFCCKKQAFRGDAQVLWLLAGWVLGKPAGGGNPPNAGTSKKASDRQSKSIDVF